MFFITPDYTYEERRVKYCFKPTFKNCLSAQAQRYTRILISGMLNDFSTGTVCGRMMLMFP